MHSDTVFNPGAAGLHVAVAKLRLEDRIDPFFDVSPFEYGLMNPVALPL